VIVTQCNDAFNYIEPDSAQEAFFDEWADVPFKEEKEKKAEATKEMFAENIRNTFGKDVDMEALKTVRRLCPFPAKMKEQFEQFGQGQQQPNFKKSKNNKPGKMQCLRKKVSKLKTFVAFISHLPSNAS